MRIWRRLKDEKGVGLVEVLVAVVILSVTAVAFLYGISTVLKANLTADIQSKALSLAESQLESARGETYLVAPIGGEARYSIINSGLFTVSTIDRSNSTVDNSTYVCGLPWNSATGTIAGGPDAGLQKITVIVKQGTTEIIRLSTFKVKLN
jgi:type II secretory pathway pseudopilin PulG